MALRAVIDHPKFARLKILLKLNKACTLGYLEGLWHFCGRYTPQGNIGKYSDADIEAWLEWDGEDGALIAAFIKARWIDNDQDHRLLIHDWHKHADDATRKAVARAKESLIVPHVSGQCRDSVGTPERLPEPGAGAVPVPEPEPELNTSAPSPSAPVIKLSENDWYRFKVAYPKRAGSANWAEAKTRMGTAVKSGISPEIIIAGAEIYCQWARDSGNFSTPFVKTAAVWISKRGWEDEYNLAAKTNGIGKHTETIEETMARLNTA